jgi:DNA-damage-inducible protein J
MAANVTARIQPNIKEQVEAILERIGIPVSVFIDMTYRQVIMRDGIAHYILYDLMNL